MLEEVKAIFETKKKVYITSPKEMLGDYKRELETISGYNGRQILELIQNCDDEGAELVKINLDKEKETLIISNTGSPFSIKGYESLSIANLSSKTSKQNYIGNKGLGFRSIINWSNSIKVLSNSICVEFSPDSRQVVFNELCSVEQQKKFREDLGVNDSVVPVAFLACPLISKKEQNTSFATSIEIHYKQDYYLKIVSQLKEFIPETLLFLKNIREIKIQGVNELKGFKCSKEVHENRDLNSFSPQEKITINDNTWSVFNKGGDLDIVENGSTEKAFYELKIAVEDEFNDKQSFLFSHFPTKVRLGFPFIIHGTFDLDQNRNYLNNSSKNKIVLKHLVELLIDTAKYVAKQEVSWKPYKILSLNNQNDDRLRELGFYQALTNAINQEKIFPCIDGEYRTKNEVYFIDDEFSKLVKNYGWENKLPQLIIPKGYLEISSLKLTKGHPNFVNIVNEISESIDDIDIRANFIKVINNNFPDSKFNLLINEEGEVIDHKTDVYTPSQRNTGIKVPQFCNIEIVNNQLYNILLSKLSITDVKDKSREFQRKLKGNFNIHSYEPTPLIEKIISLSRKAIEQSESEEKKQEIIKMMVECIYHNYKIRTNLDAILSTKEIPFLNSELSISSAKDLFLSSEFEIGRKALDIFQDIPIKRKVIPLIEEFGLLEEPIDVVESFLVWIGVKKYSTHILYSGTKDTNSLITRFCELHNRFNSNITEIIYNGLENTKVILSNIKVEQFIFLYSQDDQLKQNYDKKTHSDRFRKYNHQNKERTSQSFLSFQVENLLYDFENHLLDESLQWLNKKQVNYGHEIFIKYSMSKRMVNNILVELGAKDEFEDLSIEYVNDCIERIQTMFPNGKNSQLLYKKSVDHFKKNEKLLLRPIELFANNGTERVLLPANQIYFSDKVKIPNKLKKTYPTLNFPLRSGGAKAIEFFKINNASELLFEIGVPKISEGISSDLSKYFDDIKAYILVYRFENITKSSIKKEDASIIQRTQVHLCDELTYRVNGDSFETEKYEFIAQSGYSYYVKIGKSDTLESLKQNNYFSDCFAEILCHAFDSTNSKSEYRQTFRNNIDDVNYSVKSLHGEEALLEAYNFLEKSEFDLPLWFELSTLSDTKFNDELSIKKFIEINNEHLSSSVKYLKANKEGVLKRSPELESLLMKLSISISQFNEQTSYKVDSYLNHLNELKIHFEKNTNKVHSAIWSYLKELPNDQHHFLDFINNYTTFDQYIQELAAKNKWDANIDVNDCFSMFIKSYFPEINLDSLFVSINEIEEENNKYFDQEELDQIVQSKRFRSLRYFSNQLEKIKDEIKNSKQAEIVSTAISHGNKTVYNYKLPSGYSTNLANNISSDKKNKGVYVPKAGKSDADKKRIGDKSEWIIYKELAKLYGEENVTLCSKLNEGLHYDIKYFIEEKNTTKYVEAKTLSGNCFHLTHDEKVFGENNKENYEIWLVDGVNIIPLIDFFLKPTHALKPIEYLVKLELEFN